MRVFITGASGFIGARVTRALLSAGYEVAVLAVPGDPLKRLADVAERLTLLRGDLAALQDIRPQLAAWGPDACIHLAWYAEPGKYLHAPENIPALSRSLELLNLLVEIGCRQIVMAGTCAEYDTDYGFLREDGPTRPTTIYAATKLSLKIIAEQIAASKGVNFIWGRIFYLYGPDEDERRVVPALIKSLLAGKPFPATKGDQVRDYLHVDDIANAFLTLVKAPLSGTYNISSGVPTTMRALMSTVGELTDRYDLIQFGKLPYRDWEPPFICGDSRRLRALGWAPSYDDLRNGLNAVIAWWRDHGASVDPR